MYNSLVALASMGGLGIVLSVGLVIAAKMFAVESDERTEQIETALPGVNCGACGYAGCRSLAEAITSGSTGQRLSRRGLAVAQKIAEIMGTITEAPPGKWLRCSVKAAVRKPSSALNMTARRTAGL